MYIEMEADEHFVARGMKGNQMTVESGSCSNSDSKTNLILTDNFRRVGGALQMSSEIAGTDELRAQEPSSEVDK